MMQVMFRQVLLDAAERTYHVTFRYGCTEIVILPKTKSCSTSRDKYDDFCDQQASR